MSIDIGFLIWYYIKLVFNVGQHSWSLMLVTYFTWNYLFHV